MDIAQTEKLVGKQTVPFNEIPILRALTHREQDQMWAIIKVFTYGFIKGKQAARARRRGELIP